MFSRGESGGVSIGVAWWTWIASSSDVLKFPRSPCVCTQALTRMIARLIHTSVIFYIWQHVSQKTPLLPENSHPESRRSETWKFAKTSHQLHCFGLHRKLAGLYYKVIEAPLPNGQSGGWLWNGAWSVAICQRLRAPAYRILILSKCCSCGKIWPPLRKLNFCRSSNSVYLRRTEQIDDPQRSILSSLARLLQLTSDLPISLAILCHLAFSSLINNSANFLSYTSVRHPANLTSSGVKVSIIERRRAYPLRSPSAVIAEIMFLRNLTSWLVLSGCSNIRPTQFVDFFEFDNLLCVVDGPRNIGHTFLQAIWRISSGAN